MTTTDTEVVKARLSAAIGAYQGMLNWVLVRPALTPAMIAQELNDRMTAAADLLAEIREA